jgi:transposase
LAVPHGHWKTATLVAGLTLDGVTARMVNDGAMDGEAFLAWTERMLAPTLRSGDVVVMDNLPAHGVAGVREAIEARRRTPALSPALLPDLNQIEKVFARIKAFLRKARRPDHRHPLGRHRRGHRHGHPNACLNYFANAG